MTPVTFVVKYAIKHQSGTGLNCSTSPCPVISVFDAKRQVPDADFFIEEVGDIKLTKCTYLCHTWFEC